MNARTRRMKGKKRQNKNGTEYIIIKIPACNPEPTIKRLLKKYDCGCKKV